jgi:hypothetical protein
MKNSGSRIRACGSPIRRRNFFYGRAELLRAVRSSQRADPDISINRHRLSAFQNLPFNHGCTRRKAAWRPCRYSGFAEVSFEDYDETFEGFAVTFASCDKTFEGRDEIFEGWLN